VTQAESAEIAVEAHPTQDDFTTLFGLLDRETAIHIGPCDIQPVAILIRARDGGVLGGLWGRVVYGWLVVEMVFVPSCLRGAGTGRRLMGMAEAEARRRQCVGIQITRLDFQAPYFYELLGFSQFGMQQDVPPGHRCHYLQKRLATPGCSSG
jgi:GNAT superfamily N-acetyltransferase